MKTPFAFSLGIVLAAVMVPLGLVSTEVSAADWPAWRGPLGTGVSAEKDLPIDWGSTQNVRWRTSLPEPGNSTPIVSRGRIFLTQSEGTRRHLLCFDRKDGKLLWKTGVGVELEERTHKTNPYASASPVSDGERVIVWFGSGGLAAYDFSGKELWRTDLGIHDHRFGYGGSPVIQGELCFLNFGPGVREFLVAVDKRSGKEVWRHTSPVPGADDIFGTWSTPLIVEHQGRVELISALRGELAALDPKTGKVFWSINDWGIQAKASPVAADGVVVLSGDHDPKTSEVAVRLGGAGNVSTTHVLWRKTPSRGRVGTGVIQNGFFYGSRTGGFADCIELESGKIVWDERLHGKSGNSAIWTSPVLADGKLYFVNQAGDIFVVRASPQFELVATHTLGETCNASPAISDGEIFLRTHQALWCFWGKP
ncbi:MAG: PQQ-binding-like beta-propeller repeat protein [Opitutaceae bacterium]|nr:PQQ-binding-like beta-propeller repeat protein [Opitutaceae bacterium]